MRFVGGIRFDREEAEQFSRALPSGFDWALGIDDAERALVRRWRIRLTQLKRDEDGEKAGTEVFFEKDLAEAAAVLRNLVRRFEPETRASWWRENGVHPLLADDAAIEGLARERQMACELLTLCAGVIETALLQIGEEVVV